jgi:hypothetical protein
MARKAFVVTDAMRGQVRSLAGVGVRQEDIATIIGCDPKTLRKHFRDELDRGMAEANAEIAGCLFDAAKKGNVAAQIFWLKTRAHWRENRAPEHPIPGTDAEPEPATVIILPDNGRDPEFTQELRKAQEKYYARKRRQQPANAQLTAVRREVGLDGREVRRQFDNAPSLHGDERSGHERR